MRPLRIDSVFGGARWDAPPRVDVTADVLARIRDLQPVLGLHPYRPLIWMLTTSSALAACIAVAAVLSYRSGGDSVNVITDMISWAI